MYQVTGLNGLSGTEESVVSTVRKFNKALKIMGAGQFYATCFPAKTKRQKAQGDGKYAVTWKRLGESCDNDFANARSVSEKHVADWLRKNLKASLPQLRKGGLKYAEQIKKKHQAELEEKAKKKLEAENRKKAKVQRQINTETNKLERTQKRRSKAKSSSERAEHTDNIREIKRKLNEYKKIAEQCETESEKAKKQIEEVKKRKNQEIEKLKNDHSKEVKELNSDVKKAEKKAEKEESEVERLEKIAKEQEQKLKNATKNAVLPKPKPAPKPAPKKTETKSSGISAEQQAILDAMNQATKTMEEQRKYLNNL